MSASPPFDDRAAGSGEPPDDDVLAGELVLGVLDGAARRDAQDRLANQPAFAARVQVWERRLAPLLGDIRPVQAPEEIWLKINERLGWSEPAPSRGRLWQSLSFWRAATAVALTAAIALWFLGPLILSPRTEVSPNRAVTPLAQSDGRPGWLASVDTARGTVLMVPVPHAPDAAGRVPELWIIPQGRAPRSLGAVSIDRSNTVTVPATVRAALAAPGSVLAITLEPASGIPHAAPTGPIIASGPIRTGAS